MGFGLVIGFIEHFQMVITSDYNTLANSCTRLLTRAHAKPSQFVFTNRFLITDPNNVLCLLPYWLANSLHLTKLRVRVSDLLYDWRFPANQLVLATSPLRLKISNFIFQLNIYGCSPYVTSSLTRGWVCRLQLLLVLASAVILRSESRGTHDHILMYQIQDSRNLEGQVPVFISPRNRVARLYPQALGLLLTKL
jgi:hypothetical protein